MGAVRILAGMSSSFPCECRYRNQRGDFRPRAAIRMRRRHHGHPRFQAYPHGITGRAGFPGFGGHAPPPHGDLAFLRGTAGGGGESERADRLAPWAARVFDCAFRSSARDAPRRLGNAGPRPATTGNGAAGVDRPGNGPQAAGSGRGKIPPWRGAGKLGLRLVFKAGGGEYDYVPWCWGHGPCSMAEHRRTPAKEGWVVFPPYWGWKAG